MDDRNTDKTMRKTMDGFRATALHFLTIVSLILLAELPCHAARQAFIKINQYYVVYTMPVVPYIDGHGAFMVGLEGMTRGWTFTVPTDNPNAPNYGHGTVAYDIPARTAALCFNHHTLTFHDGSRFVGVDGRATLMASVAIWEPVSGQMIVPVAALTGGLGLTSSWDPARRVLSINSQNLTHAIEGTEYGAHLLGETGVQDAKMSQGRIVPETVRLRFGDPLPLDPGSPDPPIPPDVPWVELTVRNVSGKNMGPGIAWINVAELYRGDVGLGEVDVELPGPEKSAGPTPPISAGDTRMLGIEVRRKWSKDAPLCLVCEPLAE